MRTNEFREWLRHGYYGKYGNTLGDRTISLRTANCELAYAHIFSV